MGERANGGEGGCQTIRIACLTPFCSEAWVVQCNRRDLTLLFCSSSNVFEQKRQMSWHPQESFTPPDPNDTNLVFIMPINDTKWRVNDLSQMFDNEFRYDTTAQRMRAQPLDPGDDLSGKTLSHLRHAFAQVPCLHIFKVLDRGRCKRYPCLFRHGITSGQGVFSPRRARSRGLLPGPSFLSPLPA